MRSTQEPEDELGHRLVADGRRRELRGQVGRHVGHAEEAPGANTNASIAMSVTLFPSLPKLEISASASDVAGDVGFSSPQRDRPRAARAPANLMRHGSTPPPQWTAMKE